MSTRFTPVRVAVVAIATLALSGCSLFADLSNHTSLPNPLAILIKPGPQATKAAAQLKALQADPQATRYAAPELKDAAAAVHDALHAYGSGWRAKHLAFVAEKRIQIAQATTAIAVQQQAYKTLVAKRDALKQAAATRAQQLARAGEPVTHPMPVIAPAQPPKKVETESAAPATAPAPPPQPAQPAQVAQAASLPAQEPASSTPFSGTHGALLTIEDSSFDSHDQLTASGRDALYGLLRGLAHYPQAGVIVRGPVKARVQSVIKQLEAFGVPAARLIAQQRNTDAVKIRFKGDLQN